jgi:hypothetical protein
MTAAFNTEAAAEMYYAEQLAKIQKSYQAAEVAAAPPPITITSKVSDMYLSSFLLALFNLILSHCFALCKSSFEKNRKYLRISGFCM